MPTRTAPLAAVVVQEVTPNGEPAAQERRRAMNDDADRQLGEATDTLRGLAHALRGLAHETTDAAAAAYLWLLSFSARDALAKLRGYVEATARTE